MSADAYAPSGMPGSLTLEHGLMERAWAKDGFMRGDPGKVGRMLRKAAEAWVSVQLPAQHPDEVIADHDECEHGGAHYRFSRHRRIAAPPICQPH